jgi:hypothetical protein
MTFKSKRPPRPVKQYEGANPGTPRAAVTVVSGIVGLLDDLPEAKPEEAAPPTISEREYMGRVAALGCLICHRQGFGHQPAEVHHVRVGQGGAERAPNHLTVPLCPEHHRGSTGIHGLGPRAFERRYRVDELDLLAETIGRLCQ